MSAYQIPNRNAAFDLNLCPPNFGILTSPRREANLKKAKSATRIAAESTAVETLKKNGPDSHAVQEWDSPEELKHAEADGMDRV